MTNLTEKWKKGELPEWFYWIEFQDGKTIPTTFSNEHGFICCDVICDEEEIKQIIASMPSYKEWQDLKSKLQLKETSYDFDTARLEEENTKLKELLKEVQSKIRYSSPRGIETFADLDDTLLAKINEVLGEE